MNLPTVFYLGTHQPNWLWTYDVPLFVSYSRLTKRFVHGKSSRREISQAKADWCLDSNGFTQLSIHGRWTFTAKQYVEGVKRIMGSVGRMKWASQQDWMCEDFVLRKTGKTLKQHQRFTVENFDLLMNLDPSIPWTPVLQGQREDDYRRHVEMFYEAGFDLRKYETVGLGSVCRRQHTQEAERIICNFFDMGLKLHGFGFKKLGLVNTFGFLRSADSLAWSYGARKNPPLPGCTHKSCANCPAWAMKWRTETLKRANAAMKSRLTHGRQMSLFKQSSLFK